MRIVSLISHLFDPMIVLTVVTVIGAIHFGMRGGELLFLFVLPVTFFRIRLVTTGIVSDWDMTNRKERIRPLLWALVFMLCLGLLVARFDNPAMSQLFFFYFLWMAGFAFVTRYYKLSGHVGAIALAVGFIIHWYGQMWSPLVLFVPLVGWARIVGKYHTVGQVLAGAGWSTFILSLL